MRCVFFQLDDFHDHEPLMFDEKWLMTRRRERLGRKGDWTSKLRIFLLVVDHSHWKSSIIENSLPMKTSGNPRKFQMILADVPMKEVSKVLKFTMFIHFPHVFPMKKSRFPYQNPVVFAFFRGGTSGAKRSTCLQGNGWNRPSWQLWRRNDREPRSALPPWIASGEQTVCYGKWLFIVDFPIKNGDFPLLC